MKSLIAVCICLAVSGCFPGRRAKEPPMAEVTALRTVVADYDETRRQALHGSLKLIRSAGVAMDEEPPDLDGAREELIVAEALLVAVLDVEGLPTNPVSMAPKDLAKTIELVTVHGDEANKAERELKELIDRYFKEQVKSAMSGNGKIWKALKFSALIVLLLIGGGGYIWLRITQGKILSMLFAVAAAAVLCVYVIFAYKTVVLLGGVVLVVLGGIVAVGLLARELFVQKGIVASVEKGRQALSEETRNAFDAATSEEMDVRGSGLKDRIKRLKQHGL